MSIQRVRPFLRIFLCLAVLFSMTTAAFANGPSPAEVYTLELEELNDQYPGAVYVDLLIQLPMTDSRYAECNPLPEGFPEDAEIISYRDEDFCSYTFHYRDAVSEINLNKNNAVTFFGLTDHARQILELGRIRIAILDKNGDILEVSKPQELYPGGYFAYRLNCYTYSCSTNCLRDSFGILPLSVLFYCFVSAVGLALTLLLEWQIAGNYLFRLPKKALRLVLLTNLTSQVLFRILFPVLHSHILSTYITRLVFLEVLVYVGEFVIYSLLMKEVSWKKRLAFTLVANTLSLAVGLAINYCLLH